MSLEKREGRLVGIIGKSLGLKGELYLKLITDYPNSIKSNTFFYLDPRLEQKIKLENKRTVNKKGTQRLVVRFSGFDSREKAERLTGKKIYRDKNSSPKLEIDQFWLDDLIGMDVKILDEDGFAATVIDILQYTDNDILVIEEQSKKEHLIPFIKQYIHKVDIDNKIIILIKLPEYI